MAQHNGSDGNGAGRTVRRTAMVDLSLMARGNSYPGAGEAHAASHDGPQGNGRGRKINHKARTRIIQPAGETEADGAGTKKELKPNDIIKGMRSIARQVAEVKSELAAYVNIIQLRNAVQNYDARFNNAQSDKGRDAVRQQGITLNGKKISDDRARRTLEGLLEDNPDFQRLETQLAALRTQFEELSAHPANTRLQTRLPQGPVGAAERHILRREKRPASALAKHEVASGRRRRAEERAAMLDGRHLGGDHGTAGVDGAFAAIQQKAAAAHRREVEARREMRAARVRASLQMIADNRLARVREQIEADFAAIDKGEDLAEVLGSLGRSRSAERPTGRDKKRNVKGPATMDGMTLKGATSHLDV